MSQTKLETYPIWLKASEAAVASRELVSFLSDDDWAIKSALRRSSFDLTGRLAEAYGALDPRDKEHAYGKARAIASELYNCLRQLENFGLTEGITGLVKQVQGIIDLIDNEIVEAAADIPTWLKHYEQEEQTS